MGCLFVFFIVSLAVQKLTSLSPFFYFCFYFHSGRQIENNIAAGYFREYSAYVFL